MGANNSVAAEETLRKGHLGTLDQIFLFGDSITEGCGDQANGFAFHPALQEDYKLKLDVVNRGFGGATTNNALALMPKIFPTPAEANVRLFVIFFGANDSNLLPDDHPWLVPLPKYKSNLEAMLAHPLLKTHFRLHKILITPPPVEETLLMETYGYNFKFNMNTVKYVQVVHDVGEATKTPVVDLFHAFLDRCGLELGEDMPGTMKGGPSPALRKLFTDGLHLSPDGYKIMHEEIMKIIREALPEQAPEHLAGLEVFKDW